MDAVLVVISSHRLPQRPPRFAQPTATPWAANTDPPAPSGPSARRVPRALPVLWPDTGGAIGTHAAPKSGIPRKRPKNRPDLPKFEKRLKPVTKTSPPQENTEKPRKKPEIGGPNAPPSRSPKKRTAVTKTAPLDQKPQKTPWCHGLRPCFRTPWHTTRAEPVPPPAPNTGIPRKRRANRVPGSGSARRSPPESPRARVPRTSSVLSHAMANDTGRARAAPAPQGASKK